MEVRLVGINFCGGCNPQIDRRRLAERIKGALTGMGVGVAFNDWDAPFTIRLSGCSANCAHRYHPSDRPLAVIAGASFNALASREEELADLATEAVRRFLADDQGAGRSGIAV